MAIYRVEVASWPMVAADEKTRVFAFINYIIMKEETPDERAF